LGIKSEPQIALEKMFKATLDGSDNIRLAARNNESSNESNVRDNARQTISTLAGEKMRDELKNTSWQLWDEGDEFLYEAVFAHIDERGILSVQFATPASEIIFSNPINLTTIAVDGSYLYSQGKVTKKSGQLSENLAYGLERYGFVPSWANTTAGKMLRLRIHDKVFILAPSDINFLVDEWYW
jgi:hypothetical protein